MRETDRCATCQQTSYSTAPKIIKSGHGIRVWKKSRIQMCEMWKRRVSCCNALKLHRVTETYPEKLTRHVGGALMDRSLVTSAFTCASSYSAERPELGCTKLIKKCVFSVFWISMRLRRVRRGVEVKLIFGWVKADAREQMSGYRHTHTHRRQQEYASTYAQSHTHTHTHSPRLLTHSPVFRRKVNWRL